MFLKFYNSRGRQVGYASTDPRNVSKDRDWGVKHFKGVTRVVTQVNGKAIRTHLIITRKA